MHNRSFLRFFTILAAVAGLLVVTAPAARAQFADYAVGLGFGAPNANSVRVFTSAGQPAGVDFHAYGGGQWGTDVDTARLTLTSTQILTGPGPGAIYGPHIRGFSNDGQPINGINFYAYGTLRFGAKARGGDFTRDEVEEIATAPGPGVIFGPHVRGWRFDGKRTTPLPNVNYYAYQTLKFGVEIDAGDIDMDGYAEVLTGPGPGAVFGAQARGWNSDGYPTVRPNARINFNAFQSTFGLQVGVGDVDSDGFRELLCARGAGPRNAADFRGFNWDNTQIKALPGYEATPFGSLFGGRLAAASVAGYGSEDLIAAPRPDPTAGAAVKSFSYDKSQLTLTLAFTAAPNGYGATVSGGWLGY